MIDHLQQYYLGKAKSSRLNSKNVLESPTDFLLLKTSRRIDQTNKQSNLVDNRGEELSELKTKHASSRKQSLADKLPPRLYDSKVAPSVVGRPSDIASIIPRTRSEVDKEEPLLQALSPRSGTVEEAKKASPFNNHLRKNKEIVGKLSTQEETQLPMLPARERQIQKAKSKPTATTLESPSLAHYELLAKRYGIKNDKKQRESHQKQHESVTSKNQLVKKLPNAAIALLIGDDHIQKNHTKQQNKMKAKSFAANSSTAKKGAVLGGGGHKAMMLTPDLIHTSNPSLLNKYDSEEQILIKNQINIRHDIQGPPDYGRLGSVPAQLQNFHHAAKIYNKDVAAGTTKRGTKSLNKHHNTVDDDREHQSHPFRQKQGSFLSQKAPGVSSCDKAAKREQKASLHEANGKQSQLVVVTPDYLLSQDRLINADMPQNQHMQYSRQEKMNSTQYDSKAFNEIHDYKPKVQQPPKIEALPSLQQEAQFKASASSFKAQNMQNSGISGIVIPCKFKQLVPPPAYNSLAGSQSSKLARNSLAKKQQQVSQQAAESRQQKQTSLKKTPINIYLSQQNPKEPLLSNSFGAVGHSQDSQGNAAGVKLNMNRRLNQQKIIQQAFPIQGVNQSKNFQPIKISSKKLKQSCYSRSNSSQGINSHPRHIQQIEATRGSRGTGQQSPYAEEMTLEQDIAMRTLDMKRSDQHQTKNFQQRVKLPHLAGGNSTFSNEMSKVANKRSFVASRHDSGRSGISSQDAIRKSKMSSGVYSHTVSRKGTTNFRSTHTKAFESRTLIQPNFQPVLQEQRSNQLKQSQGGLLSHKQRSSTISHESLNLRLPGHDSALDEGSSGSKQGSKNMTPLARITKNQSQQMRVQPDGSPDVGQSELHTIKQLVSKEQEVLRQSKKRSQMKALLKRSSDPKAEQLLMKKENTITAPFETPASSQDAIGFKADGYGMVQQTNTERRRNKNRNQTKNVVTKSLKSSLDGGQPVEQSPVKTQESSDERLLIYDNLSAHDLARSTDRIKEKVALNSLVKLPPRNGELLQSKDKMEARKKTQSKMLAEPNQEGNGYASIETNSKERRALDTVLNASVSVGGTSKPKRNNQAQSSVIAIYSQQLTTTKHVSRATHDAIISESNPNNQRKQNSNPDFGKLINEPVATTASRESLKNQNLLQADQSTVTLGKQRSNQIIVKNDQKGRSAAQVQASEGSNQPVHVQSREDVLQELLYKAYQNKGNKFSKKTQQHHQQNSQAVPLRKADLLKPVRSTENSTHVSPKNAHASASNAKSMKRDLEGQRQDSNNNLIKMKSFGPRVQDFLPQQEPRLKQQSPRNPRDRSITVTQTLRGQGSVSAIEEPYSQIGGKADQPNQPRSKKQSLFPANAKPSVQQLEQHQMPLKTAGGGNPTPAQNRSVSPDRMASKASKARLFDQQRRKQLNQQASEKEYLGSSAGGGLVNGVVSGGAGVGKTRSKGPDTQKQVNHQEAKTKGLLRMIDSSASLAKIDTVDSRDATPPRHSSFTKQARQMAKRSNNHSQQRLQLMRRTSHGSSQLKRYKLEDFSSLGVIGRGSFGQVKLVQHNLSGESFALKQIQKERVQGFKHIQHIKNEKQILKDLTSEAPTGGEASFFVNFVETLQDEANLYLLLEYLPGGELLQQIRQHMSLTMDQALFYLAEVLVAIQQLHQSNIIYRDLKPENILLDRQGHIKLIDFGFSKRLTDLRNERVWTNCGTPAYAAPEVLIGTGYNYKADIWSFGILICEILGGFTPFGPKAMEIGVAQDGFFGDSPGGGFSSMPPQKIIELVQTGRMVLPKNLTPQTRDLVRKILVADPNVRLEIRDIMQHKFFEGIDWHRVAKKLEDPPYVPEPDTHMMQSRPRLHTGGESTEAYAGDGVDAADGPSFASNNGSSNNANSMLPNKLKASGKKSSAAKSSPYMKRTNPNSKVLGDFHMSKLNQVFEDF